MKAIKRNLTSPPPLGVVMVCHQCGTSCSANAADYWHAQDDFEFICCDEVMELGKLVTVFRPLLTYVGDKPIFGKTAY